MKHAIVAIFALSLLGAVNPNSNGALDVNGVHRTYVLHVPATVGKAPVPLVLSFHGRGGTGEGQLLLTQMNVEADKHGFIIVYPDGIDRGWNDGRSYGTNADDLGFVRALVADLERRYPIDPKRIYATGFSNGAVFSNYLACAMSGTIAAIAPVSGTLPKGDESACHPDRPISVLAIDGTDDPIMPYDGGEVKSFGKARGAVLSAAENVAWWARNAHCNTSPAQHELPAREPADGTSVKLMSYAGCGGNASVELYSVVGGGHAWPDGPQYAPRAFIGNASDQLDATRIIAEFFLAHPQP